MQQWIVPLSRTAEKGLDVDALRSGTLACSSLPPPRSMQCTTTTSSSSGGPTKPRPKPITRLKMPWMQLSIVQGTFSDPAIHWENIRREETNPLGKYLAKDPLGKYLERKNPLGKYRQPFSWGARFKDQIALVSAIRSWIWPLFCHLEMQSKC